MVKIFVLYFGKIKYKRRQEGNVKNKNNQIKFAMLCKYWLAVIKEPLKALKKTLNHSHLIKSG